MHYCEFELEGVSDLMLCRHYVNGKNSDETHDQYEQRTWHNKVAVTPDGQAYLNGFCVKNALESAGKWLGMKIPGEGKKTYSDRIKKAIVPEAKLLLWRPDGKPLTIEDFEPLQLFVPSGGERGKGKRVFRIFPTVHQWKATGGFHVFDGKLTKEIIERHMTALGQFIGFGAMRAENGGINGRCRLLKLLMKDVE